MAKQLAQDVLMWGVKHGMNLRRPGERISEWVTLRNLLDQLDIDCVLDVGANVGQFADELRRLGYTGKIVSFEPVSRSFDSLHETFKDDPHWTGHRVALGSTSESRSINLWESSWMDSLLEAVDGVDLPTETIQVRRLDDMLPEILSELNASRVFLKMDTQGFDLEAFRGAAGVLDRIAGLQSEVSVQPIYKGMPHYLESLAEYEAAGFELTGLTVVSREGAHDRLIDLNCFMRRAPDQP